MYPDIQLAILTTGKPNRHLAKWAKRFTHYKSFIGSETPKGIADARNDICEWFLRHGPKTAKWLLMVDDDIVPLVDTELLLDCQAKVAGPRVWAKTGEEAHPHTLSAACLKIHREVLGHVPMPWFRFSREGGCECSWFFHRAIEAGFRAEKVGAVGHRFPVVVVPGKHGARFLFDHEVADGSKV